MSSCRSSMTRGYAKSKLLQCGRIFSNHRDDLASWDSQGLAALLMSNFQRAMDALVSGYQHAIVGYCTKEPRSSLLQRPACGSPEG